MDNIKPKTTLCQVLSLVPFEALPSLAIHTLDRGIKKLLTIPLLKVFIAADFRDWKSYSSIEEGLLVDEEFLKELGITHISGSQLSRRITGVPTELLEMLFVEMVSRIQVRSAAFGGITPRIGRLKPVDSSKISLPPNLCQWAYVGSKWNGVKVHVKFLVVDRNITYPEEIVLSTGDVDDREGANRLVIASDATYVMDRGYVDYRKMDNWVRDGILFVMRIGERNKTNVVEERPIPPGSRIVKDAKVRLGSRFRSMEEAVRLVEFMDETGRLYRVVTTRWDLTAEEVAEIYKHRWLIELFFKWIKQHLPSTKIHSTHPQGIWNEIYLAMIAYALTLLIRLEMKTQKTQWDILVLIRHYAEKPWKAFESAMNRRPGRKSRGRQKVENPPPKVEQLLPSELILLSTKGKGSK